MPVRLAGSLLAAPPPWRAAVARRLVAAGHRIHVDVIDGTYPVGAGVDPDLVGELHAAGLGPVDVHLLVHDPEPLAHTVIRGGAARVIVPAERVDAAGVRRLRTAADGCGAALWLALDVATPIRVVVGHRDTIDGILLMLTPAGTRGSADPRRLDVLAHLPPVRTVAADGGITRDLLPRLASAGVDEAVLGRALVPDLLPETATGPGREGAAQ